MEYLKFWVLMIVLIIAIMYHLNILNLNSHINRLIGIKPKLQSFAYRAIIQNKEFLVVDKKNNIVYNFDGDNIFKIFIVKNDSFYYDTIHMFFQRIDRKIFSVSEDEIDLLDLYDKLELFFPGKKITVKALSVFTDTNVILYAQEED